MADTKGLSYNSKPDAEGIVKFGEAQAKFWAPQTTRDTEAWELFDNSYAMDIATQKEQQTEDAPEIRPQRSGFIGIATDRDVAILTQPVQFIFDSDGNTSDKEHVDELLEPWINRAVQLAQVEGLVDEQAIHDLRLFGRGWRCVELLPRLWAEDEYGELVEAYARVAKQMARASDSGLMAKLRVRMGDMEEEMEEFRAENFPIRVRYADARATWPQISKERRLPQVVEIYDTTVAEVVADYGEKALPVTPGDYYNDHTALKLYVYNNWKWSAVAIGTGQEGGGARLAREPYEHGLRRSPCVLMETRALNTSAEGIRWKSSARDFAATVKAQDQYWSDAMNLMRRNTTLGLYANLPADATEEEVKSMGDLKIRLGPSNDVFPYGIEPKLKPAPVLHPQYLETARQWIDYNQQYTMNPDLSGVMRSGQAAVGFIASLQAQQRAFLGPYTKIITQGAREEAQLVLMQVVQLSREFPDAPDKVTVVGARGSKGKLAVGPSDVRGWIQLVRAVAPDFLPVSENALLDLAQKAASLGVFHPEFWMETYMHVQDPQAKLRRGRVWQIQQAVFEQNVLPRAVELTKALSTQMPQENAAALAELIVGLPPAAQEVILQQRGLASAGGVPPGTQPNTPGAAVQAGANEARTGVMPAPYQTEATGFMPTPLEMV